MTVQDDEKQDQPRIRHPWQERLVIPILLAGGLLTLSWMALLAAATLRIVSAIAGTEPLG